MKVCTCGYPAKDGRDLEEHVLAMASAGSKEGSHDERRR